MIVPRLDYSSSIYSCSSGVDFYRCWLGRSYSKIAYSVQTCCFYEYDPNAEASRSYTMIVQSVIIRASFDY